jgi:hypothetical protein
MDYQMLLAFLLVVFIFAAASITLCYSPLHLENDWPRQPAKWLRMMGMVRLSKSKIHIALLTSPGLWFFIRSPLAVP